MPTRKTAIAVPEELLLEVDRVARARGESRSRFITRLLRLAVQAQRDAAITRKFDELFSQPGVAADQRRAAAALDEVGTTWAHEDW